MVDMIATAYNVNAEAVVGGPNWLGRDRFDVVAKAPQTTPQENVRLMLQDLLAQRFKVACARYGLNQQRVSLDTTKFAVPPKAGDQLSLF